MEWATATSPVCQVRLVNLCSTSAEGCTDHKQNKHWLLSYSALDSPTRERSPHHAKRMKGTLYQCPLKVYDFCRLNSYVKIYDVFVYVKFWYICHVHQFFIQRSKKLAKSSKHHATMTSARSITVPILQSCLFLRH